MSIYIYHSLNGYLEAYNRLDVATPLRVYGNVPFKFDIENAVLQIIYNGEVIEEKYYSYDLLCNGKVLIFKEF